MYTWTTAVALAWATDSDNRYEEDIEGGYNLGTTKKVKKSNSDHIPSLLNM